MNLFSHASISFKFFTVFSFFGSDFVLNGFSNPFIVYFRPNFLFEPNFHFLLVVFVKTRGILALIFCFFKKFF